MEYNNIIRSIINKSYDYSYNSHLNIKPKGSAYSDRMMEWDFDKFQKSLIKIFGNKSQLFYKSHKSPDKVELFLREYFDDDSILLLEVKHSINQYTGYPVWCFIYYKKSNTNKLKYCPDCGSVSTSDICKICEEIDKNL